MKTYIIQEHIIIAVAIDALNEKLAYEKADSQIRKAIYWVDYHNHDKNNLEIIDIKEIK